MNRILIAVVISLAIFAAGFIGGWAWRGDRAEAAVAVQEVAVVKQNLTAEQGARAEEHQRADTMAAIGARHEEDRAAAPAVADAVVADLRSGALRLRNDLAACHTDRLSQAAASAGQRDAAPDLGVTLAGPAVRIGRDADDQLRACQAVIAADRARPASHAAYP
ncbi:lysis system i-spanin subunit Rz [Stenotrophomonas lacuserhaii]|uniref:lysis system i-spanin subunit Rz n=1 Tax=Stenotrophomonas lacuserhaii TaxID=2760084 RepID=UPI0032EEB323